MNFASPNPPQVVLQAQAQNSNGLPKLSLLSAVVRVYHLLVDMEIENLTTTPLVQIGSSSVWRYVWRPNSLPAGNYFAEYTLVDSGGNEFVGIENIDVFDVAKQADVNFIKQIETCRWRIVNSQMTFYDANGRIILTFNLLDRDGRPTMDTPYERIPV